MTTLTVFILGAIQGLTELWPISSSAHLFLVPYLAGWQDYGLTMSVFLHFGTLIAVIAYFYQDWKNIIFKQRKLLWYIILATIPAAISGFLLEDLAETVFRSPLIMIINLAVFGLILGWADSKGKKAESADKLSWGQVLLIGFAQIIALVPGVSRSGITISAGLFLGLKRSQAARFSFLLLTPVLIGASVLRLFDLLEQGTAVIGGSALVAVIGLVSSILFSYLALFWLFNWLKKTSFWPFVWYRIILAAIVFLVYIF